MIKSVKSGAPQKELLGRKKKKNYGTFDIVKVF